MSEEWSKAKTDLVEQLEVLNKPNKSKAKSYRKAIGYRKKVFKPVQLAELDFNDLNAVLEYATQNKIKTGECYDRLIKSEKAFDYAYKVIGCRDPYFESLLIQVLTNRDVGQRGYFNFPDEDSKNVLDLDAFHHTYLRLLLHGDTWDELFEAFKQRLRVAQTDPAVMQAVIYNCNRTITILVNLCVETNGNYDKLNDYMLLLFETLKKKILDCDTVTSPGNSPKSNFNRAVDGVFINGTYELMRVITNCRTPPFSQAVENKFLDLYFATMDKANQLCPSLLELLDARMYGNCDVEGMFRCLANYFVYTKGEIWPELTDRLASNPVYNKYWLMISLQGSTPMPENKLEELLEEIKILENLGTETDWRVTGVRSTIYGYFTQYVSSVVKDRVEAVEKFYVSTGLSDFISHYVYEVNQLKKSGYEIKKI
jgi:hypothetical protein